MVCGATSSTLGQVLRGSVHIVTGTNSLLNARRLLSNTCGVSFLRRNGSCSGFHCASRANVSMEMMLATRLSVSFLTTAAVRPCCPHTLYTNSFLSYHYSRIYHVWKLGLRGALISPSN